MRTLAITGMLTAAMISLTILGSLMRARLATYPALSAFRHGRNGVAEREPRSLDDVPD